MYFILAFDTTSEEDSQKLIKLANKILEKCVEDSKRYHAMQVLILTYKQRKNLVKAREIVEKLPQMMITRDWFWPDVVTGIEKMKVTQALFIEFVEMFYSKLITTYGRAEVGQRDIQLLKYKEFLDIVFENGEYGFYNIRLFDIYMMCAWEQAQIKNKEKTLEYFNKSSK